MRDGPCKNPRLLQQKRDKLRLVRPVHRHAIHSRPALPLGERGPGRAVQTKAVHPGPAGKGGSAGAVPEAGTNAAARVHVERAADPSFEIPAQQPGAHQCHGREKRHVFWHGESFHGRPEIQTGC